MSKTSVFTSITPLPAGITRQSVLETYHNHTEMIELNPLVVERFRCKPPNYAPAEEFYSTWYTIKDKVSYLPGGLASGSVSYHACFHDLPEGLQTHVYAPLGLDIRAKWSVGGSLPGEPKAPVELGIGAPREGLYIREDVRMKCNIMMIGFVKKTFKESHAKLVDRLVEKAHILESEAANARLKMLKEVAPGERMGHGSIFIAPPPGYTPMEHPEQGLENEYFSTAPQDRQSSYSDKQHQYQQDQRDSNNSSLTSPQPQRLAHQSISSTTSSNPSDLHSPHLSQASNLTSQSSNLTSPLSHSATIHKPLPLTPRQYQQTRYQHKHTHSEDCDHTGSFRFNLQPPGGGEGGGGGGAGGIEANRQRSATVATATPGTGGENLATLPATTYLPSTTHAQATLPSTTYLPASTYAPRERSRSRDRSPYHDLAPPPAELPGTQMYPGESQVLGMHMKFPAELPG